MKLDSKSIRAWAAGAALGLAALLSASYSITEEVPLGRVSGSVVMADTGEAVPRAEIYLYYLDGEDFSEGFSKRIQADRQGQFYASGLPAGQYSVRTHGKNSSGTRRLRIKANGEAEDEDLVLHIERPWSRINFYASERVFLPGEEASCTISGVVLAGELDLILYRVSETELHAKRSLSDVAWSMARRRNQTNPGDLPGLKTVWSESYELTSRDVEGSFAETIHLPEQEPGVYLFKASADSLERFTYFTVSELGLITKNAGRDVLAYAVDLSTGAPVEGAAVTLYQDGRVDPMGRTNADGIVKFERPPAEDSDVMIGARFDGSLAYTWFYSYDSYDRDEAAKFWLQTDRPVYKPGDQIQFRGAVRHPDRETTWRTPTSGDVEIRVLGPDGETVLETTASLSKVGTFYGSFESDEEAGPGSYEVETSFAGSHSSTFVRVIEYRKPEYTMTARPLKNSYLRGDTIQVEAICTAFTGEPIVGAEMTAHVSSSPVWRMSPFYDDFDDFSDYDYYGSYLGTVEAVTDSQGRAVFSYKPPVVEGRWAKLQDREISFSISGSDPAGNYITGGAKAFERRGEMSVDARFDSWISQPGETRSVNIEVTNNIDGTPGSGQALTLEVFRSEWTERQWRETRIETQSLKTNSDGIATATVRLDTSGSYSVQVTAQDSGGRKIIASDDVWVSGWSASAPPAPDLRLVLDKESYLPSEEAKLLIRTDSPGGSALVTVDADRVRYSRVVKLDSEATQITIGSLGSFAPGGQVSASYIIDKSYSYDTVDIDVGLNEKRLNIEVVPDREVSKPGEPASFEVLATDDEGQPVEAEVALAVVDEGVYDILEDRNDPLKTFYGRTWTRVETNYSFPQLYLDGEDKSEPNIKARKSFKDTALWVPSKMTDENGRATFSLILPDNLTSWRATATGLTADTKAGKSKTNLISRLELMARISLPTFLTQDDETTLNGVITNGTDKKQTVEVRLEPGSLQVTSGEVRQTLTLDPRSTKTVTWMVKADKIGTSTPKLSAWTAGGLQDAEERSLTTLVRGPLVVVASSGLTSRNDEFVFDVDRNSLKARLQVRVEGSPLDSLGPAAESLIEYPYGCVEQTMSRLLPTTAAVKLMARNGRGNARLEAKAAEAVDKGLKRLRQFQHYDGGWGWWEDDSSSMRMTGVVLEGLAQLKEAGIEVDPHMISRGVSWAEDALNAPRADLDLRGYEADRYEENRMNLAAAVLMNSPDSRAGQKAITFAGLDLEEQISTRPEFWAKAASAFQRASSVSKGSDRDLHFARAVQAYERLMDLAVGGQVGLSWQDSGWGEVSGRALMAAAAIEPNSERASRLIYTLLSSRRGRSWNSTRQTGLIVLGLIEWAEKNNIQTASGRLSIEVNGREVVSKQVSSGGGTELEADLDLAALKEGRNLIKIKSDSTLDPFWTVVCRQEVYQPSAQAIDGPDGLKITRTYHRMVSKKLENGTIRRLADPKSSQTFEPGEVFRCRVVVETDKTLPFVMVTDPIPAGFRIVEADNPYGSRSYWWSKVQFFNEKAVFFRNSISKGETEFEYAIRAERPGVMEAAPARVEGMYHPDRFAQSSAVSVEVKQ